jgi:hypothetical protein
MLKPMVLAATALTLLATSTALSQNAMDTTPCAQRYESEIPFRGEEGMPHRLVLTLEGADCVTAGFHWRIYDPRGRVVFSELTDRTDLAGPDMMSATITAEDIDYRLSQLMDGPQETQSMSAYPAHPGRPGWFVFETEGGSEGSTEMAPDAWEAARQMDAPLWCWYPGSHYARCFIEDTSGQIVEAVGLAW